MSYARTETRMRHRETRPTRRDLRKLCDPGNFVGVFTRLRIVLPQNRCPACTGVAETRKMNSPTLKQKPADAGVHERKHTRGTTVCG